MATNRRLVLWGYRVLLGTLVGSFAAASCSKSDEPGGGSGGAAGHGGSGGTSVSGGTTANSGGVGVGGAAGSGGTSATGGSTNSGGAAGGSGGVGAGGSSKSGTGGKSTAAGTGGAKGTGGDTGKNDAGPDGPGGSATGGSSGAGTGGITTGTGGASSAGGATGAGGGTGNTSCAGHALSLSANGTGTASDSANAHVEVDLKTDAPTGNAKRTVEFWAFIKSTDWVGEKNQIFFSGDGTGTNTSFGLDFGTDAVSGGSNHATLNPFTGSDIRDDSAKDLGISSSTDQWVHIAMTWDGTAFVTYINGVAKITVQASGKTLDTKGTTLMIGCNPTNNNCFNGSFDEFRVWNVARSATEIKDTYRKTLAGSEAGLVGYWKFDETSGTTAADAVAVTGHTAHPGTLKADTTAHDPTFVAPTMPVPLVCP